MLAPDERRNKGVIPIPPLGLSYIELGCAMSPSLGRPPEPRRYQVHSGDT